MAPIGGLRGETPAREKAEMRAILLALLATMAVTAGALAQERKDVSAMAESYCAQLQAANMPAPTTRSEEARAVSDSSTQPSGTQAGNPSNMTREEEIRMQSQNLCAVVHRRK